MIQLQSIQKTSAHAKSSHITHFVNVACGVRCFVARLRSIEVGWAACERQSCRCLCHTVHEWIIWAQSGFPPQKTGRSGGPCTGRLFRPKICHLLRFFPSEMRVPDASTQSQRNWAVREAESVSCCVHSQSTALGRWIFWIRATCCSWRWHTPFSASAWSTRQCARTQARTGTRRFVTLSCTRGTDAQPRSQDFVLWWCTRCCRKNSCHCCE